MRPKVSMRLLFAFIALVAVALAVWRQGRQVFENRQLREENERLREEVARLNFHLEMTRIDTLLKVPTEALYQDHTLRGELDRIRWAFVEEHASDQFVPIYALYEHSPDSPSPSYFRSVRGLQDWKNSQDSFWEGYAINHADDGVQLLNGKLKGSEEFRDRLMSDSGLRDDYLKPLLMRFVRSTNQRSRLAAIESMLLLDDRRPELLEVIRSDLERLSKSAAPTLNENAVLDADYARELAERYKKLVRTHNLGNLITASPQDEQGN